MVRNEERKAFRDMTTGDRVKIMEAWIASGIEAWTGHSWSSHSDYVSHLYDRCVYRTRPRQLVIPWEVIKPKYKWAAMDKDGGILFSTKQPNIGAEVWLVSGQSDVGLDALDIDTAGVDWRESLTQRPEGV